MTVLAIFWPMGSAQWDRLELGLGGKVVDGAQSRSRDQAGNKDQFELEHVQTHSWAEGLIPIRQCETLRYRLTSGGDPSHELAVSLWAVSTLAWVLITDLKHEKLVLTDLGKGSFAVTILFFFKDVFLNTNSLFSVLLHLMINNQKQTANRH